MSSLNSNLIAAVRSWVSGAERVVALTGAGISTDSGIPDFRSPQGLWTKNPLAEKMSNNEAAAFRCGEGDVRSGRVTRPVT